MRCYSNTGTAWARRKLCSSLSKQSRHHLCVQHVHPRCAVCPAYPDGSSELEPEGDLNLQNALMQQLQIQIDSQVVKDEIKEDLKTRVERMKELGEQLKQKLDDELGIEKFRMELESRQHLSEALDQLDELEEQIAQMKQEAQADKAQLAAWEQQSASARNSALFFKSLYKPEVLQPKDDSPDGEQGGTAATTRFPPSPAALAAAAAVTSSAEEEVGSPFRMYLFTYMAVVLAAVVGQDVAGGAPSWGLDGLYAVIGAALGINAWNERRALAAVVAARQEQAQQAEVVELARPVRGPTRDGEGSGQQ